MFGKSTLDFRCWRFAADNHVGDLLRAWHSGGDWCPRVVVIPIWTVDLHASELPNLLPSRFPSVVQISHAHIVRDAEGGPFALECPDGIFSIRIRLTVAVLTLQDGHLAELNFIRRCVIDNRGGYFVVPN